MAATSTDVVDTAYGYQLKQTNDIKGSAEYAGNHRQQEQKNTKTASAWVVRMVYMQNLRHSA